MLNLSVLLEDAARETPDRDAVVFGDIRLSYSFIDSVANQVANLLRARGVRPGDKVALSCPNLPYFPMVYFGALKAGAVVVPLNVLLKPREIGYHLGDSDAKVLFCFEGTPELPLGEMGHAGFEQAEGCEHFVLLPVNPAATESPIEGAELFWAALGAQPNTFETVQTEPNDTAVIIYTSGTTGQPKGAELTHHNLLLNAMVDDTLFYRTLHDTMLATLPLFHIFGQTCVMNVGFYRHATLVMQTRFEAEQAVELMVKEKVSVFAGVPTMYWGLLTHATSDEDIATIRENLRVAVSGGSALPMEVLKGIKQKFDVDVLEGYGLSETSPVASFNRPDRPTKPGSIGLPVWGVEMKLIDEEWKEIEGEGPGEIAIRGHNIMKGYHGRPDATADAIKDGWFRTGDVARRDEDGYYFIIDRSKDMIIRGGYNVYPREVEEVLMTHPDVSLAAVVGVEHPSLGEEIKAYVIRTPGATVTEDDLVAWGKEQFASYKYPRIIEFRDELPMTATGKILKRELR
ncbi:long-chain acyl-CoA synthetase [Actinomadura pelletieri DSM 43383]|uniref:Long-chain acyl-CoA synthetase n=1 Tax=Actinomadura pelletieri DSM 43383 TaxID=1120940 RepID=A0A495QAN2_9ACTN|nr:long-chain fatty acid--CoA ligase [Actinomadura pelletieri]RKS68657.1 long-chain acyl-CoA synthetase [Actinomadura pelletieri DSM 43383]